MEENQPHQNKINKLMLILFGIFAVLTVIFTVIVKNVDVRPIGPEDSSIGLASINSPVHEALPYNELWYKLTKYSGYLIYVPPVFFVLLFFVQLFRRRSLKKVDREMKLFVVYLLAVLAIYFAFDHLVIINYRPVLIASELEPSYPSSHTLFAVSLCGASMLLVSNFLKLKHKTFMNIFLILLAVFNIVGRVISGVHWATDIFAGLLFGFTLLFAFAAFLRRKVCYNEVKLNKE